MVQLAREFEQLLIRRGVRVLPVGPICGRRCGPGGWAVPLKFPRCVDSDDAFGLVQVDGHRSGLRSGTHRGDHKLAINAKKIKADALLTGENLGQVASQTLDNMYVEDRAVSIAIIRPLIGFNKQEIIDLARQIGTYETSIEPGGCCNITPNRPEVHADLKEVERIEKKING